MALREDGWKEEKWRAKRTGRNEQDGKNGWRCGVGGEMESEEDREK